MTAEIVKYRDTQISLADYIDLRRDEAKDQWARWRDAQGLNDADKELVDTAFDEYIRTLDSIYDKLVVF